MTECIVPECPPHHWETNILSFEGLCHAGKEDERIGEIVTEFYSDDFEAFGKQWVTSPTTGKKVRTRILLWAGAKRNIERQVKWCKKNLTKLPKIGVDVGWIDLGESGAELNGQYTSYVFSVVATFTFDNEQDEILFNLAH